MQSNTPADALRGLIAREDYYSIPFSDDLYDWFGDQAPALLDRLERQDQRIAELEKALHFYADEHRYPSDGPWGVNSSDFGNKARAALTDGSQP